jgi:hypothetical protein
VIGLLLGAGLVAMVCAWGLATKPFSGADEPSQYLRTLAVARGDLVMARPDGGLLAAARREQPAGLRLPPGGYRTEAANTRALVVAPSMSPPPASERCLNGRADTGARSCAEGTYNGTYSPLGYALPALGLAVSGSASVGIWLGRLGTAVGCLAFLFLAIALALRGGRWSIVALVASLSPMVLFMSAELNPDGSRSPPASPLPAAACASPPSALRSRAGC